MTVIVEQEKNMIEKYSLYGYEITINKDKEILMPNYVTRSSIEEKYGTLEIVRMKNYVIMQLEKKLDKMLKLNEIILYIKDILGYKSQNCIVSPIDLNILTLHIGLEILGLTKLGILFLDNLIDEIFYNSKQSTVIIEHSIHGRCSTNIFLSKSELSIFSERISTENDQTLCEEYPTIKGDLITDWFHLRVTIDIPPLAFDGICFNVRKLNNHHFTLRTLILNETLSLDVAMFILLSYISKVNITIVGQPSVGKTTLQNAIMELTPSPWRVLSIEDAIESFSSKPDHLIRLKIHSDEKGVLNYDKKGEVIKLLHRAPDYLNLGEISTEDHANAWFVALSSGVPSMQTIHGNNIEALISKVTDIFNISINLLRSSYPHIIIELVTIWDKNKKIRKVKSISEINPLSNDKNKIFTKLFKMDSNLKLIALSDCLWESYTLQEVLKPYGWNEKTLNELMKNTFEFLNTNYTNDIDNFYVNNFGINLNNNE